MTMTESQAPQVIDWAVVKRLLGYFKPHKVILFIALAGITVFSLVDAGMIYFIKPLIDDGLTQANSHVLKLGALLVIAVFLVRGVASFVFNYCMAYVSSQITFAIRQQAFTHMQYLPLSYFQHQGRGKLIAKFIYDSEQIAKATSEAFVITLRESLIVLVLLGIMFYASWQLSLIFLVIGPAIAVVIRLVSRRFKKVSLNLQNTVGEVTRHCEQNIAQHKEVLACCTQQQASQRFRLVNNRNRQQSMKLATASAISNPVVQLIASLAIAAVLWLASIDGVIQHLSAGTFTATLVAMGSLLKPLKQLTNVNQVLQRGIVAANSLFDVLDETAEENTGKRYPDNIATSLSASGLSFNYPNSEEYALRNVHFDIRKGQKVALVGDSGGGKSTLLHLLLRFYSTKPDSSNALKLNGVPIQEFELHNYRKLFAVVSQQIVLLDDTIEANISYGADSDIDQQSLLRAAEAANVTAFSSQLSNGLQTKIGENGSALSGGQRQRIAIARALLKDAPILLLDEATSALDSHTENAIQQTISKLSQQKTVITIAHRLSTVVDADIIFVFRRGQIIEKGTHQQLVEKPGFYQQLYNQQFKHQERKS